MKVRTLLNNKCINICSLFVTHILHQCKMLIREELGVAYMGTLYCLCNFSVNIEMAKIKKFIFKYLGTILF